jgi:hypothetical protein
MSNDPAEAKARAVALVQQLADHNTGTLTNAQLAPIIQAVAEDLEDGAGKAVVDEERLAKVETQTRVLAAAVIAMTEIADSVAPAVKAVKDEM